MVGNARLQPNRIPSAKPRPLPRGRLRRFRSPDGPLEPPVALPVSARGDVATAVAAAVLPPGDQTTSGGRRPTFYEDRPFTVSDIVEGLLETARHQLNVKRNIIAIVKKKKYVLLKLVEMVSCRLKYADMLQRCV